MPIGRLRLMQLTRRHLESVRVDKGADLPEHLAATGLPDAPVDTTVYGEADGLHTHGSGEPKRSG